MKIKVFTKGRANSYEASGIYSEQCFIVCKGSQISPKASSKIQPIVLKTRMNRELVSSTWKVLKDITFRSPSTAAAFVNGNISDGNRCWKDKEGRSLRELRKEKKNG